MFMHKSKKGFTIVELVIVIAVIAILAAVLIPTFSNLVKKANQSADIQGARQMDTALQAESTAKKPETLKDVIIILDAADFNIKSLVPLTKNHTFYWDETSNKIVLYSTEDGILYPEIDSFDPAAATSHNLNDGKGHIKVEVKTAAAVIEALTNGQSVTLSEDVELTQAVSVAPGSDVTINLNGQTLTTALSGIQHPYGVDNNGTVTIENGTINARGILNGSSGKLVIKNATVNTLDTNGGACVWNNGGEVVIDNGTFTSTAIPVDKDGVYVIKNNVGGTITINGGTFKSQSKAYAVDNYGTMTINGGTFSGPRGAVCAQNGTLVINGGTFEVTGTDSEAYHAVGCFNANVTINGGTFTTAGDSPVFGYIDNGNGVKGTGSITVNAGVMVDGVKVTNGYTVD